VPGRPGRRPAVPTRATLLRSTRESGASKGDAVTQSWPGDWAVGNGDEPDVDTSVANPARMWNYWVGGKDNFRVAADSVAETDAVSGLAGYCGIGFKN